MTPEMKMTQCRLERRGTGNTKHHWRMAGDHWRVKIQGPTPYVMSVDFYTGVGLRKDDQPVPPDIDTVLDSLAMDSSLYQEAMREAEPLDYLFLNLDLKLPSEAEALFEALEEIHYGLVWALGDEDLIPTLIEGYEDHE